MNPGPDDIERALQKHLKALAAGAPGWETKEIGIDYTPHGAPYQRGTWMPARNGARNEPVAFGTGAYYRLTGIYQIDLFTPKTSKETKVLAQRAKAMAEHFYPPNNLGGRVDAGAGEILFDREPFVSGVDEKADPAYNRIFIEIFARIERPPS
jgi:hypothetical protein